MVEAKCAFEALAAKVGAVTPQLAQALEHVV